MIFNENSQIPLSYVPYSIQSDRLGAEGPKWKNLDFLDFSKICALDLDCWNHAFFYGFKTFKYHIKTCRKPIFDIEPYFFGRGRQKWSPEAKSIKIPYHRPSWAR